MDIENHISSTFNNELSELNNTLLEMGGNLEKQISSLKQALLNRDEILAKKIISFDEKIDNYETASIEQIQLIIAKRQPVGVDLRILVGCSRISGYMERAGDLLGSIAKRSIILIEYNKLEEIDALINLSNHVENLFNDSLNSFAKKDFEAASIVKNKDIEIDKIFNNFFSNLLKKMSNNSKIVVPGTHMLFMAKNYERIGDHATNIAECISYMATGDIKQTRPKDNL